MTFMSLALALALHDLRIGPGNAAIAGNPAYDRRVGVVGGAIKRAVCEQDRTILEELGAPLARPRAFITHRHENLFVDCVVFDVFSHML